MAYSVLNNKPILYEPSGFGILARNYIWSPKKLLNRCQAKEYALVVVGTFLKRLDGLQDCLDGYYVLTQKLDYYGIKDFLEIYLPKKDTKGSS